jgi:hypothetical protein
MLVHIAERVDTYLPHIDLMVFAAGADHLELGVRRIAPGVHPCDAARDLRAPGSWRAFGFAVDGSGVVLGDSGAARSIRSIYLVDRRGHEISLLRDGAHVRVSGARVMGRIPDACWRVMGLSAP